MAKEKESVPETCVPTDLPLRRRIWEALGGRKFIGYQETLVLILGIGYFVEDSKIAMVMVGGALAAYLLYSAANVTGKIAIGGTTIETGGNGNEGGDRV
jgi:hypothetical protein